MFVTTSGVGFYSVMLSVLSSIRSLADVTYVYMHLGVDAEFPTFYEYTELPTIASST